MLLFLFLLPLSSYFRKDNNFINENGPVTILPTRPFWYGMNVGDSFDIVLPNKKEYNELMGGSPDDEVNGPLTATISLIRVGSLKKGSRTLTYTVNGTKRVVNMEDAEDDGGASTVMADPNNDCEIASPLPGTVEEINCDENATLKKGDCMMIVVAMKMEVKVTAPFDLRIDSFAVEKGSKVEEGSLVATVTKL